MKLGGLGQKAEKGLHAVSHTLNWVSMAFIVIMVLTVTLDVGGAYLFKKPLTGVIDIIELMMVVTVFLGLGYCASVNGNVRGGVLHNRLPKRAQAGVDIFTFTASLFIVVLITWRLGVRAWSVMQSPPGPATSTLLIPHLPFIWIAVAGSLLLCLELL